MKKIGLMVVAVSLALSAAAFAAEQPQKDRPAEKSKAVRGDQARSPKALADQIAQLKQEHQAAMNELQEIKKLANEEKATKTVGALDKLIARRNQEFQKRIEPLQQRLDKLQGQAKSGDKAKTNGDKRKSKTKGQ
jgi:chaperonin cofactor prefoldin